MANQRNISELQSYLKQTRSSLVKGYGLALIQTTQDIEAHAKSNVTKQFTGRNKRTLTGRLLNSVYSGFERRGRGLPTAFVGVRGIPYGAIHEFGGIITPKTAKNLWIKNHDVPTKYKRMTPKEFIDKMREDSPTAQFFISIKNGKKTALAVEGNKVTALFFLRQKVTIPKRPYLIPAIRTGVKGMARNINRQVLNVLRQKFFGR